MAPSNVVALPSLPEQIISRIIAVDQAASIASMRSISPSWNRLVLNSLTLPRANQCFPNSTEASTEHEIDGRVEDKNIEDPPSGATLACLPHDIIRRIIACDKGESTKSMYLISFAWRHLVREHLDKLPRINEMRLQTSLSDKHYLALSASHITGEGWQLCQMNAGFETDYKRFLDGISEYVWKAGGLNSLVVQHFSEQRLVDIRKRLRDIKIKKLSIAIENDYEYIERHILDMVLLHSISDIEIRCFRGSESNGQNLCNLIMTVLMAVPKLTVKKSCFLKKHTMESMFDITKEMWTNIANTVKSLNRNCSVKLECTCGTPIAACTSSQLEFLWLFVPTFMRH